MWVGPDGITYADEAQGRAYMKNFGPESGLFGGPPKQVGDWAGDGARVGKIRRRDREGGGVDAGPSNPYTVKTERSPEADFLVDRWKGRMDDSTKRQAQESTSSALREIGAGLESEMGDSLAARGLDDSPAAAKALGGIKAETAKNVGKAMTDIELAETARQDALVMGGTGIASLPTKLLYEGQAIGNQTAQTGANIQAQSAQAQLAALQQAYPQSGPAIVPADSGYGGYTKPYEKPRSTGGGIFGRRR
jgi:hypothetical protein